MPDEMDGVQEHVTRYTDAAIDAARPPAAPESGLCACGCGEPIEPQRLAYGACRTLECQREHEAHERRYAHGHR